MSVRMYVDSRIKKADGFEDNLGVGSYVYYGHYFKEMKLICDGGDFYYDLGDILRVCIPGSLKEYLLRFTALEKFSQYPRRCRGVYKYGQAVANLDKPDSSNQMIMSIESPNFEDLQTLYNMIRQGEIQPEINWEDNAFSSEKVLVDKVGELANAIRSVQQDPQASQVFEAAMRQIVKDDSLHLEEKKQEFVQPKTWREFLAVFQQFLRMRWLRHHE